MEKNKIFCKICNQQTIYSIDVFSKCHLKKYHPEIKSIKEYYDMFIKKSSDGICPVCQKQTKFISYNKGYAKHCSTKCTMNNPESIEKIKQTNQKKYGDRNYVNIDGIKKSWDNKSDKELKNINDQSKKTKLLKYGNKNYNNFDKIRQTKLVKYGNEHYTNTEKAKESLIDFYNKKRYIDTNNKIEINNLKIELIECSKNYYKFKCLDCGKEFEIQLQEFYLRVKNNETICNICNPYMPRISKSEIEIRDFIKQTHNGEIQSNIVGLFCDKRELDIYLPELKIAIEFNGLYFHSTELQEDINYHKNKTEECEKLGIHLIHIYEDEWNNKQEIVKSRLINILHKTTNRIKVKSCIIKEISTLESTAFLNDNHLQGSTKSKINIALIYKDEIVSLMIFGDKRIFMGYKNNETGEYELIRFCNKLNTSVIGAASKLFKYFIDTYKPDSIISYADRSWTMNNGKTLYDNLGFMYEKKTVANYHYVIGGERVNRYNFTKHQLVKDGYDSNKTESEIMLERGIYRIYNSGNLKYSYPIKL